MEKAGRTTETAAFSSTRRRRTRRRPLSVLVCLAAAAAAAVVVFFFFVVVVSSNGNSSRSRSCAGGLVVGIGVAADDGAALAAAAGAVRNRTAVAGSGEEWQKGLYRGWLRETLDGELFVPRRVPVARRRHQQQQARPATGDGDRHRDGVAGERRSPATRSRRRRPAHRPRGVGTVRGRRLAQVIASPEAGEDGGAAAEPPRRRSSTPSEPRRRRRSSSASSASSGAVPVSRQARSGLQRLRQRLADQAKDEDPKEDRGTYDRVVRQLGDDDRIRCAPQLTVQHSHTDTWWRKFRKFWAADEAGTLYFLKILPEARRLKEVLAQVVAYQLAEVLYPGRALVPRTHLFAVQGRSALEDMFSPARLAAAANATESAYQTEAWVRAQVDGLHDVLGRQCRDHADDYLLYGFVQERRFHTALTGSPSGEWYCLAMCPQCTSLIVDYFIGNFDRKSNCFVERKDNDKDVQLLLIDNEGYFGVNYMVNPDNHHSYSLDVLYGIMKQRNYTYETCVFDPAIVKTLRRVDVADEIGRRLTLELSRCVEPGLAAAADTGGRRPEHEALKKLLDVAVYAIRRRQRRLLRYIKRCEDKHVLSWDTRLDGASLSNDPNIRDLLKRIDAGDGPLAAHNAWVRKETRRRERLRDAMESMVAKRPELKDNLQAAIVQSERAEKRVLARARKRLAAGLPVEEVVPSESEGVLGL